MASASKLDSMLYAAEQETGKTIQNLINANKLDGECISDFVNNFGAKSCVKVFNLLPRADLNVEENIKRTNQTFVMGDFVLRNKRKEKSLHAFVDSSELMQSANNAQDVLKWHCARHNFTSVVERYQEKIDGSDYD